jgi:uncharacterized protein
MIGACDAKSAPSKTGGRATQRLCREQGEVHALVVDGKRPLLALEISVEELFFHCAKAFLRSDAWQPQTWNPAAVPSVARLAKAIKPDTSDDQLDGYYTEDNLRKMLY